MACNDGIFLNSVKYIAEPTINHASICQTCGFANCPVFHQKTFDNNSYLILLLVGEGKKRANTLFYEMLILPLRIKLQKKQLERLAKF